MGKYFLAFGIVFSSILAFGQENRISFGLASSIDKYNFDFEPFDGIDQTQKTDLAYSFGLRVQYDFKDKLSLRSGILYSEKSYKTDYNFIAMESGDPYIPRESNLKARYLNVPLMIGYVIINKANFRFTPSAGIISELLVGKTETTIFDDNTESDTEFLSKDLSKILLSAQINVGFEYHFDRNAFVTFEPYLRYGFNKTNEKIMISKPISYGAILSINYKRKK
jgi:hypothetical protein